MGTITRLKDWETEEILFEDDLDAEFNNLYDLVNGNLDEANIADGSLDLSVVGEANSVGTSLLSSGAVTPSKMNINDDLDFGGNKASNLAAGTQDNDAATTSQLRERAINFLSTPFSVFTDQNSDDSQIINVSNEADLNDDADYLLVHTVLTNGSSGGFSEDHVYINSVQGNVVLAHNSQGSDRDGGDVSFVWYPVDNSDEVEITVVNNNSQFRANVQIIAEAIDTEGI